MIPLPPISTLFPYTTLFRSCSSSLGDKHTIMSDLGRCLTHPDAPSGVGKLFGLYLREPKASAGVGLCSTDSAVSLHPESSRSEEHTSELQSRLHLVCRLLLE